MRRALIVCGLALGAALLAVAAWREPRIRALFTTAPPRKDPLAFLRDVKIPDPPPARETKAPGPPPAGGPAPQQMQSRSVAPSQAPAAANQVPNPEVGRVLMQILKARKLADGLSLGVSDTEIVVHGTVPSKEHLQKIVEILEKGREARSIDLSQVQVGTGQAP